MSRGSPSPGLPRAGTARTIRRLVLGVLVLGLVGSGADLIALKHYEDPWQQFPLALIVAALGVTAWHVVAGSLMSVRVLQALMLLFLVAGGLGFLLHYRANMAFQLDMDPSLSGWEIFTKVIRAAAPPALAPGVMAQLGLLGLVYCYRHPAVVDDSTHENGGA